jgi:glycosyltransferase involved in cell wall biosynthesis
VWQRAWVSLLAACFRPTHVYISHPLLLDVLPKRLQFAVLVYDCMDDAVAMACPQGRGSVLEKERSLVDRADVVVVSSQVLAERLRTRCGASIEFKLRLVLNGAPVRRSPASRAAPAADGRGQLLIGYAGTVAAWFDFRSLIGALDACPDVRLLIVGPRTGGEPRHERIEYHPAVDHEVLPSLLVYCDALIMPFEPGPVVAAVNPVKLYEYLQYGVPVIARRYAEIEREFGEFVEYYDSTRDLVRLFRHVAEGRLRGCSDAEGLAEFLDSATWSRRWSEIAREGRLG